MLNKRGIMFCTMYKMFAGVSVVALCACAGTNSITQRGFMETPTVDYVESLDVYSAPHRDSFLNQLAMNYRSYAIYNARTSGYSEMGELFAQKAVAAFSGDTPFPETLGNWSVPRDDAGELQNAYDELMEYLRADASYENPQAAAEAQAKYDCWLSALSSEQYATADECRGRFYKTMDTLRECSQATVMQKQPDGSQIIASIDDDVQTTNDYYPETRNMTSVRSAGRARDGVIIVNNVNIPDTLIKTEPVQPLVFNQNIYGGDKSITNSNNNNGNFTGVPNDCPMAQQQAGQCSCQQRDNMGSCVSPVIVMPESAPQQSSEKQPIVMIQENNQTQPAAATQQPIIVIQEKSKPQPQPIVVDDSNAQRIQELQYQIQQMQTMLDEPVNVQQVPDVQAQIATMQSQLQIQMSEMQTALQEQMRSIAESKIDYVPSVPQPVIMIEKRAKLQSEVKANDESMQRIQELQAQIEQMQAVAAATDAANVQQIYEMQTQISQMQAEMQAKMSELQAALEEQSRLSAELAASVDNKPIFVEEHVHHLPIETEISEDYGDKVLRARPMPATEMFVEQSDAPQVVQMPAQNDNLVTREEFVDMMLAMRSDLGEINSRLDSMNKPASEKTAIKVQQIPLEPKQHIMEEIFEVRFDFNKSDIKPEYQQLIRKLATATQENKNIKISVIGHTDTVGSSAYNYALGGRRAEAVQKMLIQNGIPASQIVAVSSGEMDLKIPTPDGIPSEDNRRVRVIKETRMGDDKKSNAVSLEVGTQK